MRQGSQPSTSRPCLRSTAGLYELPPNVLLVRLDWRLSRFHVQTGTRVGIPVPAYPPPVPTREDLFCSVRDASQLWHSSSCISDSRQSSSNLFRDASRSNLITSFTSGGSCAFRSAEEAGQAVYSRCINGPSCSVTEHVTSFCRKVPLVPPHPRKPEDE